MAPGLDGLLIVGRASSQEADHDLSETLRPASREYVHSSSHMDARHIASSDVVFSFLTAGPPDDA